MIYPQKGKKRLKWNEYLGVIRNFIIEKKKRLNWNEYLGVIGSFIIEKKGVGKCEWKMVSFSLNILSCIYPSSLLLKEHNLHQLSIIKM